MGAGGGDEEVEADVFLFNSRMVVKLPPMLLPWSLSNSSNQGSGFSKTVVFFPG